MKKSDNKDPHSNITEKVAKHQIQFPFEGDDKDKELKILKEELKILKREKRILKINLERAIVIILQLLSENDKPPVLKDFIETTLIDIKRLRSECRSFPRYNQSVKAAGLKPNRESW